MNGLSTLQLNFYGSIVSDLSKKKGFIFMILILKMIVQHFSRFINILFQQISFLYLIKIRTYIMFSNYNIEEFFKVLEIISYRSHSNFRILKKRFASEITIHN
jgi:hypothetical protein